MKRFTLNLKMMLVVAVCLCGLSANAQFSQTIERTANTDYSTINATWKFSDVATALGTDSTTLRQALDTWLDADWVDDSPVYKNEDTKLFGVDAGDGTVSTAYQTGGGWACDGRGSYWLKADGTIDSWAAGNVYNDYPIYSTVTDEFSIPVGNHPDTGTEEAVTANLKFIFNFNGKQATFNISYTVKPFEVPAPASVFASKQNVAGTQTVSINRTDMQGYDATIIKFDAKAVADALGISTELVSNGLSKMLYIQTIDSLGVRADSLTNISTATAPGWWMKNTIYPQGHEKQGENSGLLGAAGYGAEDALFAEFSYVDGDSIQAKVGQYPGTCEVGDKYEADFYLIYQDKAYELVLNTEIVEAPSTDYTQLNVKGEQTYEVTIHSDEADYQSHSVTIDLDAVATTLGVSTDALAINAPKNEKVFYVGNTAGNEGFWYNQDGYVCAWGASAATCVENATSGQYDIYNCCVYQGAQANVGAIYSDKIYFVNGSDCYIINFNFNIVAAEAVDQTAWEIVAKRPVVGYVIPTNDYATSTLDYTFTVDQMNELIGTTSPTMYVNLPEAEQTEKTKYALATKYLCTPAPGAWLGEFGQGTGWDGTYAYAGIMYSPTEGKYSICEMPEAVNDGRVAGGKTWTAPIYFVNEETHKMIEFDFTINWVNDSSEMKKVQIVGSETITALINSTFDVDITKAATALGVTVDDLLNTDNYYFSGLLSSGLWSEGVTPTTGMTCNWDGSIDSDGYGKYYIYYSSDNSKFGTFCEEDITNPTTFKSQPTIGFKVDDKVYVYYISLYTEESMPKNINVPENGDANGDNATDVLDINYVISAIIDGKATRTDLDKVLDVILGNK